MQQSIHSLVSDAQNAVQNLLCLLGQTSVANTATAGGELPGNAGSRSVVSSSSSSSSSSGGDEQRNNASKEGLEVRRSFRRLDRVLEGMKCCFDAYNDEHETATLSVDMFVQEIQPLLVTILTNLWSQLEESQLEGWVRQEVMVLYESTLVKSCEILSESMAGFLEDEHVELLLDRIVQIILQELTSEEGESNQSEFSLTFMALLRTMTACLERREEAQNDASSTSPLIPLLSAFETIHLLQLILPVGRCNLKIRWSIDMGDDSQQDGRFTLLTFATYLLKHLVFFVPEGQSLEELDAWFQQQLLSRPNASNHYPTPSVLCKEIHEFLSQCQSLAVDSVDYALDVLDGATLALQNVTDPPAQNELIQDAIRHVATACCWMEPLQESLHVHLQTSIEGIFHGTATFVAATAAHNVSVATEAETRNLASVWLLQLARLALNKFDSFQSGNHSMNKSVMITLWVALDCTKVVLGDIQFLMDFLRGEPPRVAGHKRKKSNENGTSSSKPAVMAMELRATILATLLLPLGSGETLPKPCVAAMVRALPTHDKPSPWNAVLSRKITETYGTSLRRRGHSSPEDRVLASFVHTHRMFAENNKRSDSKEDNEPKGTTR